MYEILDIHMIEQYQLVKQLPLRPFYNSDHNVCWYVSNYGNAKVIIDNDIEISMTLDNGGLVIVNNDIKINGIGKPMYLLVYDLFGSEQRGLITHGKNKGHYLQVHHNDYNHFNNAIDNLTVLLDSVHGRLHGHDWNNTVNVRKKYYKLYQKYIDNYKEYNLKWRNYLNKVWQQRVMEIKKRNSEIKDILQKHKKEQKNREKIDKLIATGRYIERDGKAVCIKRIMPKWTTERRKKVLNARKNSTAWTNRDCCKIKGKKAITYNGCVIFVDKQEVRNYIAKGAVLGIKTKKTSDFKGSQSVF